MANRSDFYREALKDPRVKALLDTISFAEGSGPEGYRTMFTGKLFDTIAMAASRHRQHRWRLFQHCSWQVSDADADIQNGGKSYRDKRIYA